MDKIIEGDEQEGEKMIDQAKKIDPKAVEELAEEIERDKENVGALSERSRAVPSHSLRSSESQ